MATNREAHVTVLLRRIGADSEAAAELLAMAAECLKAREPMPDNLADYLARALSRAASTYRDERVSQLGNDLGLTKVGATSKQVNPIDVAVMIEGGETETQLKSKLSKEHGDISESTALKHIKKAKDARNKTHEIIESNGLSSLVRRRNSDASK